jgi:uncharacterized membrane protein
VFSLRAIDQWLFRKGAIAFCKTPLIFCKKIASALLKTRLLCLNNASCLLKHCFLGDNQDFWMSVGFSIIAIIALIIGFSFNKAGFRQQGLLILSIVILKTFLYDTRNLETIFRTLSFIILGVILLGVSFVYAKFKDSIKEMV